MHILQLSADCTRYFMECSDKFPVQNLLLGNVQTMQNLFTNLMYMCFAIFAGIEIFTTKFKGFKFLHVLHIFDKCDID